MSVFGSEPARARSGNEAVRRFQSSSVGAAGEAASIDLAGEPIAGSLPQRALALVTEWAALHHDELLSNWERARREEPLAPLP